MNHMCRVQAFVLLALAQFGVGQGRAAAPPGAFTDVRPVPGLDSPYRDWAPSLSADGLTMYFSSFRPGGGERRARGVNDDFELFQATRTNRSAPFGNITILTNLNSPWPDISPSVTADGLTLYFSSSRPGGHGNFDLYRATRANTSEPFDNASNLGPELNGFYDEDGPALSADGLTLFFSSNRPSTLDRRDLYMATRLTTTGPFGAPVSLGARVNTFENDRYPSPSADGLAVFFSSAGTSHDDVWMTTRATPDAPFRTRTRIAELCDYVDCQGSLFAPHISSDWPAVGSKLYFSYAPVLDDWDLYEATWVPEPSSVTLMALATAYLMKRTWRSARSARCAART